MAHSRWVSCSRPVKVEAVQIGVLGGKRKLGLVAAADAELVDSAVAHQLVAAAQHAGMAQLCAQIVVPQVGMGIKMDDLQIRVLLHSGTHSAQGHQVLAPQQKGELAVLQNGGGPLLDIRQSGLAGAEAQLQITRYPRYIHLSNRHVLVGAEGL